MAVKEKGKHPGRFVPCMILAALLMISCVSWPALISPTALPSQTFTPTSTITYTPTITATSTKTPTVTPIPTATPIPIDASLQTDDTILVTDAEAGYQFILPKGWKVNQPYGSYWLNATYSYGDGRKMSLGVFRNASEGLLDYELLKLTSQQVGGLDNVLAKGIVINTHGTALGYLKSSKLITGNVRSTYYNEYDILFIAEEQIINIRFSVNVISITTSKKAEFVNTDLQVILAIQDSIQIK